MIAKRDSIREYFSLTLLFSKSVWRLFTHSSTMTKGICLGLLAVSFTLHHVSAIENDGQLSSPSRSISKHEVTASLLSNENQAITLSRPKRANFAQEHVSRDAKQMADWVVDSGDNRSMPFVIVDKVDARVYVFYADGRLRGTAPALLGLARGDDSIPGIGNKSLSSIRPEERTTPAGRFVASLGYNFHRKDILWVDYDLAVSLHRVVSSKPAERRLERLATPTPLDNRISYGCINVPVKFFDNVVKPTFTGMRGIVYIMPEVRSTKEIFASYYDVE